MATDGNGLKLNEPQERFKEVATRQFEQFKMVEAIAVDNRNIAVIFTEMLLMTFVLEESGKFTQNLVQLSTYCD